MDKIITLDELGIAYIEYGGYGEFSIVDDGWDYLHLIVLSKDKATRVRDFLTYWLEIDD